MKKNNNAKFRNNNNNNTNMYNLNYRFDSISPAGKYSGTALDLIKRYNELSKEAHSAGDYVEMEVFRQYAEHYRKILTEMNERKNAFQAQRQAQMEQAESEKNVENTESGENMENADKVNEKNEEKTAEQPSPQKTSNSEVIEQKPLVMKRKTLKIVEVKETESLPQAKTEAPEEVKPKRVYKKRAKEEVKTEAAV